MRRLIRFALGIVLALGAAATGHASEAGQVPLGYRVAPAAYPWTGRLHAIALRATSYAHRRETLGLWQAGELLDQRATHGRHIDLGGTRQTPLRWASLDDDARAVLDTDPQTGMPDGRGADRLSWLRGNRHAEMRPRDTRLGSGSGARVRVVPPPAWQPMQPGHAGFRSRHARRPTTVWLGTRDGIVHGFEAVTGHEIAGYLPRAMLADAAALTAPGTPVPQPPCVRPDAIDADPAGEWRSLLLCTGRASRGGHGTAFVLDVSTPDAAPPIRLVWEVTGTDVLPLTGSGPLRAAMLQLDGERRWFAVAIVGPVPPDDRPGLALLPLDRPAAAWAASGRVPRLSLPVAGCDAVTASTRLLAASVLSDAAGIARAAYALDDAGRLWRFPLAAFRAGPQPDAATCLHRQTAPTGARAEAPVVTYAGTVPLIVYGSANIVSAIPDTGGKPRWTLSLPPGEQIDEIHAASPVHLTFTTLAADGSARSYLVDAATGEPVTVIGADGKAGPAATGLPFDPDQGPPIVTVSPTATGSPNEPGKGQQDVFELELWQVDGTGAHLQQHARITRRRGRLGWRELIRTPL